jgi:hypothetical protein
VHLAPGTDHDNLAARDHADWQTPVVQANGEIVIDNRPAPVTVA